MSKKLTILCVILASLIAVTILPQYAKYDVSVMHQHENYPAENTEITGFDKNGNLTSHLPLVIIENNGSEIPGSKSYSSEEAAASDAPADEELYCKFSVIDNDNHINSSKDSPTQTGKVAVNVRGRSSRYYAKKQYAVRTVDDEGSSLSTSFLGMPAGTSWVLNGSYIDYSQIRNYMLYNISSEIMDYAPASRFCEVFTTNSDGKLEYQGLYTFMEKPNEDEGRLSLTKYDPKFAETSFLLLMNQHADGIKIEHLNPDDINTYSFDLKYPDADVISDRSLKYVKNEMLTFEKSLYDALYSDEWDSVESLINMDSFIDYYIINEFFQNYDAGVLSTYLYKDLGGKISIGPVWDFDGAFNNFVGADISHEELRMKGTFYYYYLSQDEKFTKKCVSRYESLRKTVLSDEYLTEYIDSASEYLGSAAKRNCDKWYDGNYAVIENDLKNMKSYVLERGKWMDENFKERIAIA